MPELKANSDGPDVFKAKGRFLANDFPLVPGLPASVLCVGFHDELLQLRDSNFRHTRNEVQDQRETTNTQDREGKFTQTRDGFAG
jgi:hypothetical protein